MALLAGAAALVAPMAWAQDEAANPESERIVVWGRAIELIGEAQAASQGIVGYADFETRPLSRAGELVEVIPGVVATQHSGTGKANQYFMRGFNLDHGTDFSGSVDGVPINMRTHGHGQGYLDLNFIIPEIVERVEYRKGPYYADAGDFSAAGATRFVTYDALTENFVQLGAGENGYGRALAAGSFDLDASTTLLAAGEYQVYDGPWVLDEELTKLNAVAKLTRETGAGRYGLELWAYDAEWASTDQVPLRAIESGLIDRLGFIDPDLGGETTRFSLVGDAAWDFWGGETTATAYATGYEMSLWSDFTYLLDDPVNGDEFEQHDHRIIYGGEIAHVRDARFGGRDVTLTFGAATRYDDIDDVGLFKTAARERLETVRQDAVEELSVAVYAEAEVPLTEHIRATLGLRGDYYDADVDAVSLPANSGSADDSLLSPSVALAWRASDALELYANYGQGFHSNDARGATISVDPSSGDPVDPVELLAKGEGGELGARFEQGPFNATVAAFWLDLDSELVFVGDAGTTEANDATRRVGIEAAAFYEAADWLVFDVSAAYTDAKFRDAPSDFDRIPNAVETVVAAGATALWDDYTASLRVRHFGEAPLIEDNSVKSEPTTVVNLGASYEIGRVRFEANLFNAFDSEDADITYFFESQLPGEAFPVEDIHLHPVEPRQLRLGVRVAF
jgi:outer membrane receptor protein involved in Fe transport